MNKMRINTKRKEIKNMKKSRIIIILLILILAILILFLVLDTLKDILKELRKGK